MTRYNRKSVTVVTDAGQRWNVAPSLLRWVDSARDAERVTPNLIQLHKK